jgi:hypothetical protein
MGAKGARKSARQPVSPKGEKQNGRHRPGSFSASVQDATVGASALGPASTAIGIVVREGLSFEDTARLFRLLFTENFPRLRRAARNEARRRVDELLGAFGRQAQHLTQEELAGFAEPDAQYVLTEAIQASARRDHEDLREVLARLIAQRMQATGKEMKSLVLGEAVRAASKLTSNQFHIIALCFVVRYAQWIDGPPTWQGCNKFLSKMAVPFMGAHVSHGNLAHIEYAGCGSTGHGVRAPLHAIRARRYPQLFSTTDDYGPASKRGIGIVERNSELLLRLCEMSDETKFDGIHLTSVGIALATTIIAHVTGEEISLDRWLT